MFVKKSSQNKTRGIGLLELMLSLAIIAILLVMATRYFMAANESQKINNAISEIHGIAGGAANYANANPGYKDMSITKLIEGNYIPASMGGTDTKGTGANPWNGDLAVAVATAGTPGFSVSLTAIPTVACGKLANMLQGSEKSTATCTSGTVKVEFH